MDQFCTHCGEMEGYSPDDHDCLGNIQRQIAAITRRIGNKQEEDDYNAMSRTELLELDDALSAKYEALRGVTNFFSAQLEQAQMRRTAAYNAKQEARQPLNRVRAALRRHLAPVGLNEEEEI